MTFRACSSQANTSWPPQEKRVFGIYYTPFVARILTPLSRKSGYGLLLGCRSSLDSGSDKTSLFWRCSKREQAKNREIYIVCSDPRSQSIGRGRISREGALDHRESRERRDKIFAAQTVKRQNFQKKWIRKTVFSGEFSFFGRGKTNFFGGGGITSKLASQ